MADSRSAAAAAPRFSFLPAINSRGYYLLLALVAIFILGPLGGIAAAYMNFSLGFFIGGQVLPRVLGRPVTPRHRAGRRPRAEHNQANGAPVARLGGHRV